MRVLQRVSPRLIPIAIVMALMFCVDAPHLKPAAHGQKPMFPVLARLEVTRTPAPGGVAQVVASITAWVPGEQLAWTLAMPPELRVVNGPTSWSGELAQGETRTFEIGVLVPDAAPHELTAILRSAERANVRSAATISLDLGGFDGPRGTERIVSGDGVNYIEYRGTVIPR